jgi:hypothetical protein
MGTAETIGFREAPASLRGDATPWWERPYTLLALIILSAVPLLWPDIPPLVDLPGHMGRYKVQLDIDRSAALQSFYSFEWRLIGNLGVDLLVVPLSKLFGLELAVKLIVLTIPPLTVFGFLWVAREVHGWVPPTAFFAVPLAYNFPFLFGFVNFALSMALAFLAFAFWLRLARLGKLRLRAALFIPISLVVWVTHVFGWGTLGLMALSAEFVRQLDNKRPLLIAAFRAGIHCLALAPPVLLILLWRTGQVAGGTGDWFNWILKFNWFAMIFRDRWYWFDLGALVSLLLLLIGAALHKRLEFSRNLAASSLFLLITFLLLPRILFGSAYADMRLAPYMLAVLVIAIRFRPGAGRRLGNIVAGLGLLFVLGRTAGTTVSSWLYDRTYDRELAALAHVPEGSRMVSFVGRPCREGWMMSRLHHLPALAVVRREAFSNDQWGMAGAQLLSVKDIPMRYFRDDPSQVVIPQRCWSRNWLGIEASLRHFPRSVFDHVWLIDPPAYDPAVAPDLRPLWRNGSSVLYRVEGSDRPRPRGE